MIKVTAQKFRVFWACLAAGWRLKVVFAFRGNNGSNYHAGEQ
jgi:hypothetical protein